MNSGLFLTRLRVPLSWGLGVLALGLARPTPLLLGAGLGIALIGEGIRTWAAGYLLKGEELTQAGPYAWTRNPLYLGSFVVGTGFSVATGRWEVLVLFGALFLGVYLPVIRREAAHLAEKYPPAYARYAERVPLLFPRWPGSAPLAEPAHFAWRRVWINKEHLTWLGWLWVALVLGWKMG